MAADLKIVEYPHPALRHKSKPLKRVDAEVRAVVARMFDLMREAKGVGLAANQVNLPYRLFVVSLPDDETDQGEDMVFINPVITARKGSDEAEEGCLSLPGLYAQVRRPTDVTVSAYDLEGREIRRQINGLFARVVQHETDHLDGVLFIDRLSTTAEAEARDAVAEFESRFRQDRKRGEIPDDKTIAARLAKIEEKYC